MSNPEISTAAKHATLRRLLPDLGVQVTALTGNRRRAAARLNRPGPDQTGQSGRKPSPAPRMAACRQQRKL
jgi:hypothetical protein